MKLNKKMKLTFLFSAILLSGCGTQAPRIKLDTPDSATVTVHNHTNISISLLAFRIAEDCSGGMQSLVPGPVVINAFKGYSDVQFKVPANKEFSFYIDYFNMSHYPMFMALHLPMTFTPLPHKQYEVDFAVIESNSFNEFNYNLQMHVHNGTAVQLEPTFRVRKKSTWGNSGALRPGDYSDYCLRE